MAKGWANAAARIVESTFVDLDQAESEPEESPRYVDERLRRGGRPSRIDWITAEKVYIEGIAGEEGTPRAWPTYVEIGQQFGCSSQYVAAYSQKRNWAQRRLDFRYALERGMSDDAAKSRARGTREPVAILDDYLALFDEQVTTGKLRPEAISDFAVAAKLRHWFKTEGDKSTHQKAPLSLEQLQAKHKEAKAIELEVSDEVAGVSEHGDDGSVQPSFEQVGEVGNPHDAMTATDQKRSLKGKGKGEPSRKAKPSKASK